MPAQAAARVKTSVLAIGRRDFVKCKCRLVDDRRAESARAELGHNSAELIRQNTHAHFHAHGGSNTGGRDAHPGSDRGEPTRDCLAVERYGISSMARAQPRECAGCHREDCNGIAIIWCVAAK